MLWFYYINKSKSPTKWCNCPLDSLAALWWKTDRVKCWMCSKFENKLLLTDMREVHSMAPGEPKAEVSLPTSRWFSHRYFIFLPYLIHQGILLRECCGELWHRTTIQPYDILTNDLGKAWRVPISPATMAFYGQSGVPGIGEGMIDLHIRFYQLESFANP